MLSAHCCLYNIIIVTLLRQRPTTVGARRCLSANGREYAMMHKLVFPGEMCHTIIRISRRSSLLQLCTIHTLVLLLLLLLLTAILYHYYY
jgi:hypothetical protein